MHTLTDTTYEIITALQNTYCTSTDQVHESTSIWYGRTPDGKVWKCTEVVDQYNSSLVYANAEYLYTCGAHPYCSECSGYCSRAIPAEEDAKNWRIF